MVLAVIRAKRRYLALEVDGNLAPQEHDFLDAVWRSIVQIYGESGASLASLVLIDYNADAKRAILRVSLAALDMTRTALALITHMGNCALAVHVLSISGTLKLVHHKEEEILEI